MRKLIKAYMNDETITMYIVTKDKNGKKHQSKCFYITINEVLRFFAENSLICRDIGNFLCINTDKETILLEFTWLSGNGYTIQGYEEKVYIKYNEFRDWFYKVLSEIDKADKASKVEPPKFKSLNHSVLKHPVIEFKSSKNLRNVLDNKVIKTKFIKFLKENLMCPRQNVDKIYICDDFANYYSFYFVEYYNNGSHSNGGIIFHKNNKAPDDLSKGNYNIHT